MPNCVLSYEQVVEMNLSKSTFSRRVGSGKPRSIQITSILARMPVKRNSIMSARRLSSAYVIWDVGGWLPFLLRIPLLVEHATAVHKDVEGELKI